jgi:hypothetical protein
MPGFVVDISTTMTCPHGGKVTFVPAGPAAVLVNGQPVMTGADQITVIGCSLAGGGGTPCAKVQWSNLGSALVNGAPVLLQAPPTPPGPGAAVCMGSATPGPPILVAMAPLVTGT